MSKLILYRQEVDSARASLARGIQKERRQHDEEYEQRRKVAAAWNSFDEKHGCFADEWNRDFMPEDAQGR